MDKFREGSPDGEVGELQPVLRAQDEEVNFPRVEAIAETFIQLLSDLDAASQGLGAAGAE